MPEKYKKKDGCSAVTSYNFGYKFFQKHFFSPIWHHGDDERHDDDGDGDGYGYGYGNDDDSGVVLC